MAGRGATTFQKRQKEQLRKEKREAKLVRRQQKKLGINVGSSDADDPDLLGPEGEQTEQTERSDSPDAPKADSEVSLIRGRKPLADARGSDT